MKENNIEESIQTSPIKKNKSKLRENIETIFSAILIALVIRMLIVEAYKIPSSSMVPTLIVGDRLLVNKFIYGVRLPILGWKLPAIRDPKRGEIIVFHYPKYKSPGWWKEILDLLTLGILSDKLGVNTPDRPKNFIKRLIGLPGDIFSFKNQQIAINDKPLILKDSLNDVQWKKVKDIFQDPSIEDNYRSNQSWYKRESQGKTSNRSDKSDPSMMLWTEEIGKSEHIIQVADKRSFKLIPFLYIPRKGDKITIAFQNNAQSVDQIIFKRDGNSIGRMSISKFKDFYNLILIKQIIKHDTGYVKNIKNTIKNEIKEKSFKQKLKDAIDNFQVKYDFNIENSNIIFNQIVLNPEILVEKYPEIFLEIIPDYLITQMPINLKIKNNYYLMMGDNRDQSSDSREWGFVHEKYIIGKPIIIYWPYARLGVSPE